MTYSKLLLALKVVLAVACTPNPRATIKIGDVSKPVKKDIMVEITEGKNVDKLNFHITGQINDTAKIDDHYFIYPGKIDTTIRSGDWYSSNYKVVYDPMKVTKGSIEIVVEFIVF